MRVALLACASLLAGLLTACGSDASDARSPTAGAAVRVATLAPHLAELVASAGGEELLVGVSAYSDFPASVSALPVVGDGFRIDAEALLAVRPTLVLVWGGGGQQEALALVERLGFDAVVIDTRSIADVAAALRRIGSLIGTSEIAEAAAARFVADIEALSFSGQRLDVFYQIGEAPMYTVNGDHFISELISRCGGRNIFAGLAGLAPVVSVESVLRADPDVILRAAQDATAVDSNVWQRWPAMTVNRLGNHLTVPADLVVRPSVRLADGGRAICAALSRARRSKPAA